MNALEIKNRRRELGLTQADLAKKLGVSLKTVSNYENGEVIPESKKELLLNILSNNTLQEPALFYELKPPETDERIIQALEKLEEVEKVIQLAEGMKGEEDRVHHNKHIAKLIKEQISLIRKSNKDISEEKAKF